IRDRLTFQTEVCTSGLRASPSPSVHKLRQRSAPLELAESGKEGIRPNPHGVTLAAHHDSIVAWSTRRVADTPALDETRLLGDLHGGDCGVECGSVLWRATRR